VHEGAAAAHMAVENVTDSPAPNPVTDKVGVTAASGKPEVDELETVAVIVMVVV
jgi:hypothetical protein